MLHTPTYPSVSDSLQISRYDIIALNFILEDFYNKMNDTEEYQQFSLSTDTLLNQIGQYIDSNSTKFGDGTPIVSQNGRTSIFSPGEVGREIIKTRIAESLDYLQKEHSLNIIFRRNENKEYFRKCFESHTNTLDAN